MIDLARESLLTLAHAAELLPPGRRGRHTHPSTVLRWILGGVRTPTGRVHLEGIRLGGRWLTSKEALQRFAERQTPDISTSVPATRTPTERRRAREQAAKILKEKYI
jgi:hypothetical protein